MNIACPVSLYPGCGQYLAVVTGGSLGGMNALREIVCLLPENFAVPLLVVLHLHKSDGGRFCEHLSCSARLPVCEALDKQNPEAGHIYTAPADYHLLVERNGTLALALTPKVNYARPSIDVLFESAARAFGSRVIGVILSGANHDGAIGMQFIDSAGGLCIAQDPATAESPVMPSAAIDRLQNIKILTPFQIGEALIKLCAAS